jgi:hypothetical protein
LARYSSGRALQRLGTLRRSVLGDAGQRNANDECD